MDSFARLAVWFIAVLIVLQLVQGGWPRLRTWGRVKLIGAGSG